MREKGGTVPYVYMVCRVTIYDVASSTLFFLMFDKGVNFPFFAKMGGGKLNFEHCALKRFLQIIYFVIFFLLQEK